MNGPYKDFLLLVPLTLGVISLWMLLPHDGRRRWFIGGGLGLLALLSLNNLFLPRANDLVYESLFYLFGGGAVIAGTMMITDRNPVYAALWFAMVTLCVCGLFLLNEAPFLAAATIVVYAGAIVVTFVFVIMLAQQGAAATYDRRSFQPLMASIGGFLLLGGLLYTLQEWGGRNQLPGEAAVATTTFLKVPAEVVANPLSGIDKAPLGSLKGVGRSLFGDYLYVVELAGTVLLVATIGAIALSPRRSQGTL